MARRSQAWTYVSGVMAVAETRLLTAGEVEDLAQHDTVERLRAELHQLEAYRAMAEAPATDGLRSALEAAFVERVNAVARDCPDPTAATIFLRQYDFQRLRRYAQAQAGRAAQVSARLGTWTEPDLERGWQETHDARPDLAAAAQALRLALAAAGDDPGRVADLVGDRLELADFLAQAELLRSTFIREWSLEYVRLRAAMAVLRGLSAGANVRLIRAHLLTAPVAEDWLTDLAERPAAEAAAVVADRAGAHGETAIDRLAVRIDDRLTELMQPAKCVAFGPERVFGYVWGLWIENVNLRLIARAAEAGLGPEALSVRLRHVYG